MKLAINMLAPAAFILMAAAPAFAHSTVKSVTPASGSVLLASPAEIVITFNEPARMTSIVVDEPGAGERKLDAMPSGLATTFTLPAPKLGSGRNEIKWKALSKDGHPIQGSIIIVIRHGPAVPGGTNTTPEHKDGH
jgi:copper resistance protein C